MRNIVFDIETSNTFREVGSKEPADLDISLLAIHDSQTDEYSSFLKDELSNLWPILETADMLIGYNSNHFDIPLLNKYYPGDLTQIKSLDLLEEIRKSIGRRLKLDTVAEATLCVGKSSHGLQAITWWRNGEVEKVRKYCLQDVKVTKEIYEYALENKLLKYKDSGKVYEIPMDVSEWSTKKYSSMTHSMGF